MTNQSLTILKISSACLMVLYLFIGNASSDQRLSNAPTQIWAGEVTGMAYGKLVLNAWEVEGTENEFTVKSRVKVKLKNTGGFGSGDLMGTIKGKIKDGLLQAKFSGTAYVSDGSSQVFGNVIGTLSGTQGFGTYNLTSRVGQYKGKWTIEKQ